MTDLRKEASNHAVRISAYLRVRLRTWLRENCDEVPKHLWLDLDLADLTSEATRFGCDVEPLLEEWREEIVTKIHEGW